MTRGYQEVAVGLLQGLEELQTAAEGLLELGVVEDAGLPPDVPVLQLEVVGADIDAELLLAKEKEKLEAEPEEVDADEEPVHDDGDFGEN